MRYPDGTLRTRYTREELLGLLGILHRRATAARKQRWCQLFGSRFVRMRLEAGVALLGMAHLASKRASLAGLQRLTMLDLPRITMPKEGWRYLCGFLALRQAARADTMSQAPLLCGIKGRIWSASHIVRAMTRCVATLREDYRDLAPCVLLRTETDLPRITCWEYQYMPPAENKGTANWQGWDDLLARLSPLYPGHPPILRGRRAPWRKKVPPRRPYAVSDLSDPTATADAS
mgnify:CR=1 FL=1